MEWDIWRNNENNENQDQNYSTTINKLITWSRTSLFGQAVIIFLKIKTITFHNFLVFVIVKLVHLILIRDVPILIVGPETHLKWWQLSSDSSVTTSKRYKNTSNYALTVILLNVPNSLPRSKIILSFNPNLNMRNRR